MLAQFACIYSTVLGKDWGIETIGRMLLVGVVWCWCGGVMLVVVVSRKTCVRPPAAAAARARGGAGMRKCALLQTVHWHQQTCTPCLASIESSSGGQYSKMATNSESFKNEPLL